MDFKQWLPEYSENLLREANVPQDDIDNNLENFIFEALNNTDELTIITTQNSARKSRHKKHKEPKEKREKEEKEPREREEKEPREREEKEKIDFD